MKIIVLILGCFLTKLLPAQEPILWTAESEKKGTDSYLIKIKAKITKGWHIYSNAVQDMGLDGIIITWDNENISKTDDLQILTAKQPGKIKDPVFEGKKITVYTDSITLMQRIKINGLIPLKLKITIKGFASNNLEFLPIEEVKEIKLAGGNTVIQHLKLSSIDIDSPINECGETPKNDRGLMAIFLLGFAGGLIALLTPCVFPMVPVTVSYFTNTNYTNKSTNDANGKKSKRINTTGVLYGLFIFLIYLFASLPFHLLGNINPEIFNSISTNAWVNVFFFTVFVFFALSLFGLFELRLPSSLANSTGNKGGIFFMALTLAIVSFSCTGPILGSLLVGSLSSNNGAWQLTAGMGGFGLALALPFALFAMFPQWIKKLPKSGQWMDVVKKSLAFVELALAIKFLSNADLVEHWGILKREVFIGLWLIIALSLAVYLLTPHPFPLKVEGVKDHRRFPKGRLLMGILSFLFTLYLIPGLTQTQYANLKLLSGFAPPLSYSIYGNDNVHGKGLEPDVINDYEKALALSKKTGKPLLIDFTGWACVNCRKMEELVWTKPEIKELIKEKYILVSLYVDDRKKLPADKRFTYKSENGNDKEIKTIGDKWATFQAENFGQVTQPLYVVLSPDEKLINNPMGYEPDVRKYKEWLECGAKEVKRER